MYLLAAITGLLTAAFYVGYIRATATGRAATAAAWDLCLMLSSSGLYQSWAATQNDFWLLLAYDLGSVIGTYLVIKYRLTGGG